MTKRLAGKNAVITGCAGGIGRATLERFAAEGANCWAHVRRRNDEQDADFQSLCERFGVEIWPVAFDLTSEQAVTDGCRQIAAMKKPVDILVNNAGAVGESALFQMTPMARIRELFEVNFFGPLLVTQILSRLMTRRKSGSIVFISSIAGIDGDPAQLEYSAAKGALLPVVKKLARELGPFKIRVNAIAPGLVETAMGDKMSGELARKTVEATIFARRGTPDEIARAVCFLASDDSSFITGEILRVDGGR